MRCLSCALLLVILSLTLANLGCAGRSGLQQTSPPTPDNLARQVLVTIPLHDIDQAMQDARRLAQDFDLLLVAKWRLRSIGLFCAIYQVPDARPIPVAVRALTDDPLVHSAQPVRVFQVLGGPEPDPYVHLQPSLTVLQVSAAHRVTRGKGAVVAVIDTGVAIDHPDLRGQVVEAKNFVGEPNEGFTGDRHGTGVAGVVAAAADNGVGIVGVAPEATLWALKACWRDDAGRAGLCSSFTLAKALDFAVRGEVDVINLSLAGPRDEVLTALLNAAIQQGTVVVAAHGEERSGATFPALLPGVIGVKKASPDGGDSDAAIPAPGQNVLTTVPPGSYDMLSGNSLAAAHVSGGVALMRSLEPALSPGNLRSVLADSVRGVSEPDGGTYPIVDLCAAISKLGERHKCH